MHFRQPCRQALPLVLFLAATGVNADEADAFNFFAGANVVHDDNVFRLAPDANALAALGTSQRSDNMRTTFVGGSFDKLIGRQRLKLDTTLNVVRFERFTQLDNNGGNVAALLNWTLTDTLTGTLGKSRTRALAGFRDLNSPVRNVQTGDNEFVTADLRLQPSWHLEGGARRATSTNGAEVNKNVDSVTEAYSAGIRFTPASGNYVVLKNTWTSGRYPNTQFVAGSTVDNGYSQTDAAVEAGWTITGTSKLSGFLARTERTHKNVPERNFSGWTGSAAWDWAPSGKTSMTARVRREIGAQGDLFSSYVLTNAFSLSANWVPSAKTSLRLSAERAKRDYLGDPVAVLSFYPKRHDTLDTVGFNANYVPMRSLVLGFAANKEKRISNYANVPYDDNNFMVSAQFSF